MLLISTYSDSIMEGFAIKVFVRRLDIIRVKMSVILRLRNDGSLFEYFRIKLAVSSNDEREQHF